MNARTRSPIKDRPLRNPGQSVEESRHKLWEERIEGPLWWAAALTVLAAMEVLSWHFSWPRHPILLSVMAAIAVAFLAWRAISTKPLMKALHQAIEGEKAVGQYLEKLRTEGYDVFHDVPGVGFNLDHVIIGPAGAFTVETKTWSKPIRGDAKITFDGEKLVAGDQIPDRDPIVQARAQVSWLADVLRESTGRKIPVHGVVLFPGWYVEQGENTTREIWVLNPKALPEFLKRAPQRLEPEDVRLACYHLSRYVRGFKYSDTP